MATIRPISMALTIPRSMSPAMLRKLHLLAEQRCAYFIELHQSGRWRHYYTAEQLAAQMREAAQIAERSQQMLDASGASAQAPQPNVIPLFAKAS
jgi:hypothetical protein